MFITPAFAQAANGAGGAGALVQLMPFILIIAVLYFLIIRPQQRRLKEHREMVAAIQRGDVVVTAGGLIGKVVKAVGDEEIQVELGEGVRVRVVRSTVSEVRPKDGSRPGKEASPQEPAEDATTSESTEDDDEAEQADAASAAERANGSGKTAPARTRRPARGRSTRSRSGKTPGSSGGTSKQS